MLTFCQQELERQRRESPLSGAGEDGEEDTSILLEKFANARENVAEKVAEKDSVTPVRKAVRVGSKEYGLDKPLNKVNDNIRKSAKRMSTAVGAKGVEAVSF